MLRLAPRTVASASFALALAACAPAAPAGSAPRPSGPVDPDAPALLLRLEDRREYDAAVLEAAAASASADARRRAALAAGRIGDRRATPLLSRLLADPDTAVAASAAFALGELGDTAAVPALVPYVSVDRMASAPAVVGEAALALGKMPTAAGRAAVEGFLRSAPQAGRGVERAVGQALLAVWRFPRPAEVAPILPWLASPDAELRWRAAYALSRRPHPQGTEALFARAADTDALVRSFAMRALTAPLADSSSVTAARALPAVLAGTRDPDHAVSVSAARTLGSYAAPESIRRLEELLAGEDAYLAIPAAESLGRLAARAAGSAGALRAVAADTAKPIALRTAAVAALAEVAPGQTRPAAQAMVRERDWRARAAAVRAFARIGAEDQVIALAQDPDARVAAAAIEGAAADTTGIYRSLIHQALGHPDVMVRTNALGALARAADPARAGLVLLAFQRAQRDTLNDAALAALDALRPLRPKLAELPRAFFESFPRSGDYLVRQRVAEVFGDTAAVAWGPPLPIDTGRELADYRRLVSSRASRRAVIETNRGEIEVELFAADAPLTVENFLSLAGKGFFDAQQWPRVVPNFVIQGGDPRGDTSGGPGYAIRDEINRHPYLRGTLGMALSGPDTGGSQWFVTHSPQPHLDGGYTVFGRVTRGMEVADRILPGDTIARIREVR